MLDTKLVPEGCVAASRKQEREQTAGQLEEKLGVPSPPERFGRRKGKSQSKAKCRSRRYGAEG